MVSAVSQPVAAGSKEKAIYGEGGALLHGWPTGRAIGAYCAILGPCWPEQARAGVVLHRVERG